MKLFKIITWKGLCLSCVFLLIACGLFYPQLRSLTLQHAKINSSQTGINEGEKSTSNTAADYFDQGDIKTASKLVSAQLDLTPNDGENLFLQGRIFERQQKLKEASEMFQRAVEQQPENVLMLVHAGYASIFMEQLPEAGQYAERAFAIDPVNSEVLFLKAQLSISSKFLEDALTHLDNAIMFGQHPIQYMTLKAKTLMDMGRETAAVVELRKIIDLNPQDVKPRITLMNFFRSKQQIADAQNMLEGIIELQPERDDLKRMYALNKEILGDSIGAELQLRILIKEEPKKIFSYMDLANLFLRSNNYYKATQILHFAKHQVTTDEQQIIINGSLSYAYMKMGQLAPSKQYMEETLKLDEKNPLARLSKATFHLYEKQYEEGKAIFLELLQENDRWGEVYMGLAYVLDKTGEGGLDDINSLVQQALSYRPNDPGFLTYAAKRKVEEGEYTEAQKLIGKAMQLVGEKKNHFIYVIYESGMIMGDIASANNQIDKSIMIFNNLLQFVPNDPELHIKLCTNYLLQGDYKKAKQRIASLEEIDPKNELLASLKEKLNSQESEEKKG